jgi:hypothetical protein
VNPSAANGLNWQWELTLWTLLKAVARRTSKRSNRFVIEFDEETMKVRNLILAAAIAVATASSPALAASYHKKRAGFNAYGATQDAMEAMSPDRAQALRDCNGQAARFLEYTWGVQASQIYRSCMTQHGQPE